MADPSTEAFPPHTRTQRLVAEALGTAVLVGTLVGAGLKTHAITDNVAVALWITSVATGAILIVLLTVLGPVSGAHLNPALTFAFYLRRSIPLRDSLFYAGAQLIGAFAGHFAAHALYSKPMVVIEPGSPLGPTEWCAEALATFGLIFTILGGGLRNPRWVPTLVGVYIIALYWFTATVAYANPAIAVARAFADSFPGLQPAGLLPLIVTECLGAAAAVYVVRWMFQPLEPAK